MQTRGWKIGQENARTSHTHTLDKRDHIKLKINLGDKVKRCFANDLRLMNFSQDKQYASAYVFVCGENDWKPEKTTPKLMKCHTVDGIQIRVEGKKVPFASRKFYLVFVIRYICGGQRAVTTTLTMTTAKIIMDKLVIPIHILILMLTLPYTNRSLNFGSVVCMSSVHSDRMFFVALQIVVSCLVFAV